MIMNIILCVFIFVNLFYVLALSKKNFSVIDIGWGLGFIVIALASYFQNPLGIKNAILLLVVTAWGLRLSYYLLRRNSKLPEDYRYTKMREEWGATANLQAYFKVFLLQGALMLIISLPISIGMKSADQSLNFVNRLGFMIWLAGITLEALSDAYLAWFKKQPENKGKLCMTGPWKFCRFPNYLGEITLWYGVYLIALNSSNWWTIIGPVTINFFILKVSGVPLTEARYKDRPEYLEYAKRVPRFFTIQGPKGTTISS